MKDYYAILDLKPGATLSEVKEQYRFLMQTWHPDKYTNPEHKSKAEAKAREINEAYAVLSKLENQGAASNNLTLAHGVTLEFVRVPAGAFMMGSADTYGQAWPNEKPQHRVTLSEYWIGKYPVTNGQYRAYAQANGWNWSMPAGKETHPVTAVSWDDAAAFCGWVSKVSGRNVRLPSEAQWEKAARGVDARIYPWGDAAPSGQLGNCNSWMGTTVVGKYSPQGDSPYGAADMAGNVKEWVADWYDDCYYAMSPASNPQGPATGSERITRGGSWSNDERNARAAVRFWDVPSYLDSNIGFRVVSAPVP